MRLAWVGPVRRTGPVAEGRLQKSTMEQAGTIVHFPVAFAAAKVPSGGRDLQFGACGPRIGQRMEEIRCVCPAVLDKDSNCNYGASDGAKSSGFIAPAVLSGLFPGYSGRYEPADSA